MLTRVPNGRKVEYTTPVYPCVVRLDQGHDLYNGVFVQSWFTLYKHTIIKVMSLIKAYYTGVYWSSILYLPSIIYS